MQKFRKITLAILICLLLLAFPLNAFAQSSQPAAERLLYSAWYQQLIYLKNILCGDWTLELPQPEQPQEIAPEPETPLSPQPVDLIPANPPPVDPAPVNPTPVNPVPVNPQPVEPTPTTPTDSGYQTCDTYASEVIRLVNEERQKVGLSALSYDAKLAEAAKTRSEEIINSFSHNRPDGRSCFTALAEAGVSYRKAGENIAIGQTTPSQVVKAWMDSPGHKANILSENYTRIGIGVTVSSGSYQGYAWAQFFAD